jgi:hypothetical protein
MFDDVCLDMSLSLWCFFFDFKFGRTTDVESKPVSAKLPYAPLTIASHPRRQQVGEKQLTR